MVCGPLLRALLPTDRKALLCYEKRRSNLMPHQFNVTMVAALNNVLSSHVKDMQ